MILVVYVLPPGDLYARRAQDFARSYAEHDAGVDHEFLLVLKADAEPPVGWSLGGEVERHTNDGWDVGSYQRVAAERPDYDLAMFLGSHTRILADGWLTRFRDAVRLPGVGAVAATGSFETGLSGIRPNPHLRTHAFMLAPSLLNALGFGPAHTRLDTYEFEHGSGSLYRRLRERSLEGVVVGRSGVYREADWATSGTYRRGEQDELLVADKHTDHYAAAGHGERIALARMAGWDP